MSQAIISLLNGLKGEDFVAVTPSDSTVLTLTQGIYIGTSGDLVVLTKAGTTATFKNISSGVIYPIQCTKVGVSSTAADILAVY